MSKIKITNRRVLVSVQLSRKAALQPDNANQEMLKPRKKSKLSQFRSNNKDRRKEMMRLLSSIDPRQVKKYENVLFYRFKLTNLQISIILQYSSIISFYYCSSSSYSVIKEGVELLLVSKFYFINAFLICQESQINILHLFTSSLSFVMYYELSFLV